MAPGRRAAGRATAGGRVAAGDDGGGLGIAGATSLLLALLAGASAAGAWAGVIGRPELGLVAAAEAGIALERLALVPYPGATWWPSPRPCSTGWIVVVVPERGMRGADRQRLAARARQRGAVLLSLGPWPGADGELGCAQVRWQGAGDGTAASAGCARGGLPAGAGARGRAQWPRGAVAAARAGRRPAFAVARRSGSSAAVAEAGTGW